MTKVWIMVLVAFLLVIFVQTIFSYFQLRAIYRQIGDLRKKYNDDYYLVTGASKSGFSLTKNILLLMVVDSNNKVVECRKMSGYTVFARFKETNEYTNFSLNELLIKAKNKKVRLALKNAISLLENKKLEYISQ